MCIMQIALLIVCLVLLCGLGLTILLLLKLTRNDHNATLQTAILEKLGEYHVKSIKDLHSGLQLSREETTKYLRDSLHMSSQQIGQRVDKLTETTEQKLKDISGQVDKRLNEGFEKTHQTFADIVKRLALIDEAQKKITELSTNVVSLKDLLADKRSRGAFGEVQLAALIRNMLPEQHFALQHTLGNEKRCDCILFLPEPTGNIVIDAKFPLESYQVLANPHAADSDRHTAQQQFRRDIKKHIDDIASKYIVPGETTDSAIMFIPAEAVFAEIHAHYPELVEASHKAKVWLASPTTMMAILTTVRAVLKDDATRKQVHLIQQHLTALSKDFGRFQKRMDGLQRHIELANKDVQEVNVSARKISARFDKIEQVELANEEQPAAIT